ncbi:MAG: hypothetical protein VR72_12050 [Clostridiaceae bacterium BRH_c20a]|nr:MAG: hypothetical protein VR72_12050 [Clostridiaceae bacterium BRH_c20a]
MVMSFKQMIFFGIPEGISVALFAFVLSKAELEWKKIILIGVVLPFTAYLLRLLPITFGVHTIVYMGVLFFMLNRSGNVDIMSSTLNSIITMLTLIILEVVTSLGIMNLFKISPVEIEKNILLNMLVFYPHVIIMFILSYILRIKGWVNNGLFKNQ